MLKVILTDLNEDYCSPKTYKKFQMRRRRGKLFNGTYEAGLSDSLPSGHMFPVFLLFWSQKSKKLLSVGGKKKKDKRHQTELENHESNVPFSSE